MTRFERAVFAAQALGIAWAAGVVVYVLVRCRGVK